VIGAQILAVRKKKENILRRLSIRKSNRDWRAGKAKKNHLAPVPRVQRMHQERQKGQAAAYWAGEQVRGEK